MNLFATFLIAITLLSPLNSSSAASNTKKTFRLHLSQEPTQLDPNLQNNSNSTYLLSNLYRNFFRYENNKGLVPDLGETCTRKTSTHLVCTLKKNLKWSDSTSLTSEDFLRTYRKILNPQNKVPRADLLFRIKNAKAIYQGRQKPESLGITATSPQTLEFFFSEADPEFEYNLSTLPLVPTKPDLVAFNGPYKLKEWQRGRKIFAESNKFYVTQNLQRPVLEFLFIEEDSVALQLYEKNSLDFLRRLPTLYIPSFKGRNDFHWIPIVRFDYFGFGPELKDHEDIRKALIYSLNYSEWQKLFSSEGRPGCAGLPDSWFPNKAPCFDFDLKKVPAITSTLNNSISYSLSFSSLGGDDHKRASEWMQAQWQKNTQVKIQILAKENKVYLKDLKTKPAAIFRKGVTPDRPTCLSALETFSQANPENYLQLRSSEYEKILLNLSSSQKDNERKKLCLKGVEFLMNRHLLIPTGAIHFSVLAKKTFTGWNLNEINQLDLSDLRSAP